MEVKVLNESGYTAALLGLGLSFGITSKVAEISDMEMLEKLHQTAVRLCDKGNGEDKFLRQMAVWLSIKAPLFWWKQMDQYRISVTTQSESTMHTLMRTPITQECFEGDIDDSVIDALEEARKVKNFDWLNRHLPHSWLQRRIWTGNYANLKNIIQQRRHHKLPQWRFFIQEILSHVDHPEFLPTAH